MHLRSSLPRVIVALSLLAFAGCELAVVGGGDNTNVNDNTVDNVNDNTADNANTNADGNVNDDGNDNVDTTNLAVFDDPDSDFTTTDVYDIDDEIVRFDTVTLAVIWVADDRAFDEGVWSVNGNLLGRGGPFQVRFGTVDGQRRAYFTETGPATICDLVISGEDFLIFSTSTLVPQE